MTRYTNFGRKRTYVEATFGSHNHGEPVLGEASTSALPRLLADEASPEPVVDEGEPAKKRRKRSRKPKPAAEDAHARREERVDGAESGQEVEGVETGGQDPKVPEVQEKQTGWKKSKDIAEKALASEQRRLKRLADRHANTICFACRESGHAAKDCPSFTAEKPGSGKGKGKDVVGICYRCGSNKHTLSRCRKPANAANPLPFASCFVCAGKGHLASACPQNKSKGVYPNGGSCKLCGETAHLAKDCGLRKPEVVARAAFLGTGREAGPDEDDFHTLRRRTAEVDRDEQGDVRARKDARVRVGAHSGVVKAFGAMPQVRKVKVVNF
ncbi:hypothetical protein FA95DRAFT_1581497 [Auriscalpium vulgare]|uniref:Uncharacterized protein n=1 Tax=Auriscalpium vulgare TaxID=40419 RepID=A0ACB8S055_9AGAM|nr:hypothetical protein FA95DRAFT_1581497 [Auriscalpium vulgare]